MVKYYTRYGIDTKHDDGKISTSDYNRDEPLHLFYLIIGLDLQDFESYLTDMEKTIHSMKIQLSEQDEYAFNFLLADDYEYNRRVEIRYPYLLRNTVLASLYSLMEEKLITFYKYTCSMVGKKPKIFLNDMYLSDYIKLIEKELNFKFKPNVSSQVHNYRLIRNCIIHSRGKLNNYKYIKPAKSLQKQGIKIIEDGKGIYLEEIACKEFMKFIKHIFIELCEVLIEKIKSMHK